jgi:signal peptidase
VAVDRAAPEATDAPVRRARWRAVLTWILILGAVSAWTAFLRPASLGGSAGYVIVSGESMEPTMHTGDLAIVRAKSTYSPGDVVAYRIPRSNVGEGMLVIHRVIGGSPEDGLILQGDNRDHPDVWRPTADDVVGSLLAHLPHAGTALFLFRTPLVLATAAGLLGFWFIVLRGTDEEPAVAAETQPAETEVAVAPIPRPQLQPAPVAARRHRSLIGPVVVGVAIGLLVGGSSRR